MYIVSFRNTTLPTPEVIKHGFNDLCLAMTHWSWLAMQTHIIDLEFRNFYGEEDVDCKTPLAKLVPLPKKKVPQPQDPEHWSCWSEKETSNNKKENNMFEKRATAQVAEASANINVQALGDQTEKEQRQYLLNRLSSIQYDKFWELRRQFKIDEGHPFPKTPEELIKLIKEDKFKLTKYYLRNKEEWEEENDNTVYEVDDARDLLYTIDFEGIAKPDFKAWEKANKAHSEFHQKTKDEITLLPIADGYKALKRFQEWKYEA